MANTLVSVVIATYNRKEFLEYAVKSVLNQTYKDFELIIIDDGSNDGTNEFINSISDDRIRYVYQQNSGQNAAKNLGLLSAKGKYISILDSDDIWHPEKIERQVRVLEERPEVGLVYCGSFLIDSENNLVGNQEMVLNSGDVMGDLLMKNFLYNGSNAMFRAECINKVGVFDESVQRMTDWDLYLRIAVYYDFAPINKYLLMYRVHGENMSCGFEKYEVAGEKVLERLFNNPDLKAKHFKLKNKAYSRRYAYMARRYFENGDYEKARKNIKESINKHFMQIYDSELPFIYLASLLPKDLVEEFRKVLKLYKFKTRPGFRSFLMEGR